MTEPAVFVHGRDRPESWVVTCDHATNRVPLEIAGGSLGIPAREMARHIAYDIGAAPVSLALANALNATAIQSNFSRLVIDPNRGEGDPTLLMKLYDGTIIPENRHADGKEVMRRLEAYYRPYHSEIASALSQRKAPILVAVHSFTPRFRGRAPRPWHVSILHTADTRLSAPLLDVLRTEKDLVVGQNEPYSGYLRGDSVDRHATAVGHPNVLIEIRQDLIETADGQKEWADRLAYCLDAARAAANL